MKNVKTFDKFINESKQEVVYMAPKGRNSLIKYNEKIAEIISDDSETLTIKFKDGKTLTEVPKEQVRYIS